MSDQERRRELAQQAIIEEQQREIAELRRALEKAIRGYENLIEFRYLKIPTHGPQQMIDELAAVLDGGRIGELPY